MEASTDLTRARWQDFRRLWAGQSVSMLGTEVTLLAIPLTAVVTLHASAAQVGVLGAATYAPYLAFGVPGGLVVDRYRRRTILIISDIGQFAAIGSVPLMAALGVLSMPALLAAAFIAGSFAVFFQLAYSSYLPAIIPVDALTAANSRLTASSSAAEMGGPGLGGLLAQAFGAPYALILDSLSYLVSALGLSRVRQREPQPERDTLPLRAQVAEGFTATFRDGYLRAFAGEAASYNLCWQAVQTVLVLYAIRELRLSQGTLGLTIAVGAVGALLGALGTAAVARRFGLGATLIATAVIGDAAPLALPFLRPGLLAAPLLGAAFFVRGIGVTGCNVHVNAIRQTITPDRMRGRTNAAYRLLASGVVPLGALLGGLLGTTLGVRTTLAIATVCLLGTSMFLVFSPVRRVRTLTDCLSHTALNPRLEPARGEQNPEGVEGEHLVRTGPAPVHHVRGEGAAGRIPPASGDLPPAVSEP
jgi:MFS family permease